MAGVRNSFVYRVFDLPLGKVGLDPKSLLAKTIQRSLTDEEQKRLELKIAYVHTCDSDDTSCALVEFKGGRPKFLSYLDRNSFGNWQVEMEDEDINFDHHFFGFNQLYKTSPDDSITAE